MTRAITPTEELKIRQVGFDAWSDGWANCTNLTPRQAFAEGHFLAFSSGLIACRKIHHKAGKRIMFLEVWLIFTHVALLSVLFMELMR